MVYVPGSKGCLFPRPYQHGSLAVSTVCVPGPGLSVQGPPLQPDTVPQGVHQGGGSCASPPSSKWSKDLALFGRLANLRSKSQSGAPGHEDSYGPRSTSGLTGNSGKKPSCTNITGGVCGATSQFSHYDGLPHSSEGDKACDLSGAVSAWQTAGNSSISEIARDDFSCGGSGSPGPAQSSTSAEVVKCLRSSSETGQTGEAQGDAAIHPSPAPVERQGLLNHGGSIREHPIASGSGVHGCLPKRLGCSLGRQDGEGCVGPTLERPTHQLAGAEDGPPSVGGASPLHQRQTCFGEAGQLLCGLPHQSPRGHQVSPLSPGDQEALTVGVSPSRVPQGTLHPRGGESGSGSPIQDGTPPRRMAFTSAGGGTALIPIRQGSDQSLCINRDCPLQTVVLPGVSRGPPGTRCSVARVAERLVIRFSPISSDSPCPPQGDCRTLQGSFDSSQVAGEAVVSGSTPSRPRPTMAPASQGRPTVPGRRSDLAPQTSNTAVVGVAALQPQSEELDEAVLQTIRSARALSTQTSCGQKWRVFSDWCHTQQVDPSTCSVHLILCFLQSLLDSGKASSTMRLYSVAISAYHEPVGGSRWGDTLAGDSGVSLWPNPALLPKVVNPQTVNQVIEIGVFRPDPTLDEGDLALSTLCPVRALRAYSLRHSHSQLFVCYGGNKLGAAVSKQRLSHWVVDTISQAYEGQRLPMPGNLVAHSVRSMATS